MNKRQRKKRDQKIMVTRKKWLKRITDDLIAGFFERNAFLQHLERHKVKVVING